MPGKGVTGFFNNKGMYVIGIPGVAHKAVPDHLVVLRPTSIGCGVQSHIPSPFFNKANDPFSNFGVLYILLYLGSIVEQNGIELLKRFVTIRLRVFRHHKTIVGKTFL